MFANMTHLDPLPPGLHQVRNVVAVLKNTQLEHGGAKTNTPPRRVFHTLGYMYIGYIEIIIYDLDRYAIKILQLGLP